MKKLSLVFIFAFGVVSFCFGSGSRNREFDPTPTQFEGEWFNHKYTDEDGNEHSYSWKFTGNNVKVIENEIVKYDELFTYNKNEIVTYDSNNKITGRYKYSLYDLTLRIDFPSGNTQWQRQEPHFSIGNNLWNNKEALDDFPVNQAELASIQGMWEYNNKKGAYTFSGNEFTLINSKNKKTTGTIKINDGMLVLVVGDEPFGIYYYEFQPDGKLKLLELCGHSDSAYGTFTKQLTPLNH